MAAIPKRPKIVPLRPGTPNAPTVPNAPGRQQKATPRFAAYPNYQGYSYNRGTFRYRRQNWSGLPPNTPPQPTLQSTDVSISPHFSIPSSVVFWTGTLLVIITNFTNSNAVNSSPFAGIWNMIWNKGNTPSTGNSFSNLPLIITEEVFVIALSLLANISGDVSNVMFTFLIALWILWAVNNYNTVTQWFTPSGSVLPSSSSGKAV